MSEIAERLRALLLRIQKQQALTKSSPDLQHRLAALRAWQAQRLALTYADIRQRKPFVAACEFFLNDLYGEGDFGDRDRAVERVVPIMLRLLPEAVLNSLARAIELNALSQELDSAMALALPAHCNSAEEITDLDYARAYLSTASLPSLPGARRARARKAELVAAKALGQSRSAYAQARRCRREQLALLLSLGRELDRLVRKPLLNDLLRMCRWPAKLAGLGALQSFLERGFAAFGKLNGAGKFLSIILQRERAFMVAIDRLIDGDPSIELQAPNSWSR